MPLEISFLRRYSKHFFEEAIDSTLELQGEIEVDDIALMAVAASSEAGTIDDDGEPEPTIPEFQSTGNENIYLQPVPEIGIYRKRDLYAMTYPQLLEVAAKFGHEIPNNFRDTEPPTSENPPMSEYPPMSENRTVETIEKEDEMFEQVIALILKEQNLFKRSKDAVSAPQSQQTAIVEINVDLIPKKIWRPNCPESISRPIADALRT